MEDLPDHFDADPDGAQNLDADLHDKDDDDDSVAAIVAAAKEAEALAVEKRNAAMVAIGRAANRDVGVIPPDPRGGDGTSSRGRENRENDPMEIAAALATGSTRRHRTDREEKEEQNAEEEEEQAAFEEEEQQNSEKEEEQDDNKSNVNQAIIDNMVRLPFSGLLNPENYVEVLAFWKLWGESMATNRLFYENGDESSLKRRPELPVYKRLAAACVLLYRFDPPLKYRDSVPRRKLTDFSAIGNEFRRKRVNAFIRAMDSQYPFLDDSPDAISRFLACDPGTTFGGLVNAMRDLGFAYWHNGHIFQKHRKCLHVSMKPFFEALDIFIEDGMELKRKRQRRT